MFGRYSQASGEDRSGTLVPVEAKYIVPIVKGPCRRIEPERSEDETPFLPVPNRYRPFGMTGEVDFTITRSSHGSQMVQGDQVALVTTAQKAGAMVRLESNDARNELLGLLTPYEHMGIDHTYAPAVLVQLNRGVMLSLQKRGFEAAQSAAKHNAARRCVSAVNNAREYGQ